MLVLDDYFELPALKSAPVNQNKRSPKATDFVLKIEYPSGPPRGVPRVFYL